MSFRSLRWLEFEQLFSCHPFPFFLQLRDFRQNRGFSPTRDDGLRRHDGIRRLKSRWFSRRRQRQRHDDGWRTAVDARVDWKRKEIILTLYVVQRSFFQRFHNTIIIFKSNTGDLGVVNWSFVVQDELHKQKIVGVRITTLSLKLFV
jgi:hypothetical protein